MKESSWFQVLVLGGAALVGACVEDEGPSGDSSSGPTTNGPGPTATVTTSGPGSGGASNTGGNGQGGEVEPACSAKPSPNDPCGCPCCWVQDCLNTEECCVGWCGDCC